MRLMNTASRAEMGGTQHGRGGAGRVVLVPSRWYWLVWLWNWRSRRSQKQKQSFWKCRLFPMPFVMRAVALRRTWECAAHSKVKWEHRSSCELPSLWVLDLQLLSSLVPVLSENQDKFLHRGLGLKERRWYYRKLPWSSKAREDLHTQRTFISRF